MKILRTAQLILSFALAIAPVAAQDSQFRVVGITDGDTITVLDNQKQQIKVRLAGIDAPEKSQDFGNRSKQNLSSLVFGKTVNLEGNKVDRYGRRVAKIIVDGIDANLAQVRAGLAWHFKRYEKEQSVEDRRLYSVAEEQAQKAKRGIWSIPNPTAPWDFRANK